MKRTTVKKRKYLYRQQKAGVTYVYFRNPNTGKLTPLPSDEQSPEFDLAYQPLLQAAKAEPHVVKHELGRWKNPRDYSIDPKIIFRPGSIGWLIDKYKASREYAELSDGTRANYGPALLLMKKEIGTGYLHDMTGEHVDLYSAKIDREKGGSVADQQIGLISNLWEFAKGFPEFKRKGKLCPTLGATRHYEHDGEGILAWPDHVFEKFVETAKPHLIEIVNGLRYTGQRGSDLVTMLWTDYNGEKINVVQQKTGERIWLHCPAPLRKMLDNMPRHSKFIFNSKWKRPYLHAGTLGTAIRNQVQKKLGFVDYSMHGLRKNAGMELALASCSVPEIMAVLGHKSPKMAMFYVKQASKITLGETATAKLDAYLEKKQTARTAERRAEIKVVKT